MPQAIRTTTLLLCALSACASPPSVAPCVAGQAGCACAPERTCDDQLVCSEDSVCEATRTVGLPSIHPDARACELLLEDSATTQVVGVSFGGDVQGELIVQPPRAALAFAAGSEGSIDPSNVRLELAGGEDIRIRKARCFGHSGEELPTPGIPTDG